MVIETYTQGPAPVYERAAARGRMLPDGLRYLDSCGVVRALGLRQRGEATLRAWDQMRTSTWRPSL
jgi:hypothetical protein